MTANPGWALTAWPGFFAAERRNTPGKGARPLEGDTKPKPAPREELAKVNRRERIEVPTITDPQGHSRRIADDYRTGSHLEVGDLTKYRDGSKLPRHPDGSKAPLSERPPDTGSSIEESSVDPRNGSEISETKDLRI